MGGLDWIRKGYLDLCGGKSMYLTIYLLICVSVYLCNHIETIYIYIYIYVCVCVSV